MKNSIKIIIAIGFVAIAGFGVFANLGVNKMSNLALANIEALARNEIPEVEVTCGQSGGVCWASSGDCYVSWFIRYDDCSFIGYTSYECDSPCLYD